MSKRIILTDFEIEQLVHGLKKLKDETSIPYEVIKVGKRFYEGLIEKLQPSQSKDKSDV